MGFTGTINSIINKLQSQMSGRDDSGLNKLEVELKLLKTFGLFVRKIAKQEGLPHPLSTFEKSVQQSQKLWLDGLISKAAVEFREAVKKYRQEIREEYARMLNQLSQSISTSEILSKSVVEDDFFFLDSFLQSWSPYSDEYVEFIDSLLENLKDILIWGDFAHVSRFETLLETLQEKIVFMKIFIRIVRLKGRGKHGRLLLRRFVFKVVSAAHLCYICWFYRDDHQVFDGMHLKISELIENINPGADHVRLNYINVLEFGDFDFGSSLALSSNTEIFIVGDFVESLLGNLWELLTCGTNFMVSVKHQMHMLYEGLRFLRNILKKEQEKYNGLHEKNKDLVPHVVEDAGIVIFSLYQNDMDVALVMEMDVKLFHLLENLKLIKADVEEKYPVTLRFNFPTINELGFINLLLENLKELESCKVDPISFAKDRVQTIQRHLLFLRSCLERRDMFPERYPKNKAQKVQEEIAFYTSFLENYMDQNNQHEKFQVQKMQEDLLFLRSFLENNVEQRNQHEELQALWSRVTGVAYKAEFVIDSLSVGDISLYSLMSFDNITEEIEHVKCDVSKVDVKKFVIEAQNDTKILRGVASQSNISTINEVVVDLKDRKKAIIDRLKRESKKLEIVSIVGMPGLGKTTLAKKVYHDSSITCHFHILAWCCISQVYCEKDLLLEILACIDQNSQYSEMDDNDLANKLRRHLKKKKYLIVLDDIWDIEAWNALKNSFPDDNNGSRILLTSRLHKVTGEPHHLMPLTDEESWELLKKKLRWTAEEDCPPALSVIGKQIAKKCNGLPLSVVIVSGLLANLEQVGWEEIAKMLSSNIVCGTENCRNILELSYRHLPDHLKPCLLYFGAFPEDQEIPIRRLMWLWMAEGFVLRNDLESPEKMAEDYIMALINRSLVMVGQQRSIGGAKTCHIHDLLHEFCVLKAKEENFLQLVRGYDEALKFDEPQNLRRLCIHSQPKHFVKSRMLVPNIRSLLYASRGVGSRQQSYNLSFISLLKLLKVLDLGQINIGFTFPREIGLLVQLRYLSVLGRMKDISSSIVNLSNLETFLLTTYDSIAGLALLRDAFWNMQTLRHLHVGGALIDLNLAEDSIESSSNLYNLDTFSTPKLYVGQSMEKTMRKFPNIRKLKCSLSVSEESTGDSSKIVAMDFLSRLESLKLLLGNMSMHHIDFNLPKNLKKLTLEDFSLSILSMIGELPNLEVLKLCRGEADGIEEWDMKEQEFPKMKFMKLEALNIVRWTGSNDHFPCLEKLVLEACVELEELPSLFYVYCNA